MVDKRIGLLLGGIFFILLGAVSAVAGAYITYNASGLTSAVSNGQLPAQLQQQESAAVSGSGYLGVLVGAVFIVLGGVLLVIWKRMKQKEVH